MPHQCRESGVKRTHDGNTRRLRAATLAAAASKRLYEHDSDADREGDGHDGDGARYGDFQECRRWTIGVRGSLHRLDRFIVIDCHTKKIRTHDPAYYSCPGPFNKSFTTKWHALMRIVLCSCQISVTHRCTNDWPVAEGAAQRAVLNASWTSSSTTASS